MNGRMSAADKAAAVFESGHILTSAQVAQYSGLNVRDARAAVRRLQDRKKLIRVGTAYPPTYQRPGVRELPGGVPMPTLMAQPQLTTVQYAMRHTPASVWDLGL
jgi:hypothetical protein